MKLENCSKDYQLSQELQTLRLGTLPFCLNQSKQYSQVSKAYRRHAQFMHFCQLQVLEEHLLSVWYFHQMQKYNIE